MIETGFEPADAFLFDREAVRESAKLARCTPV
jgi:hypothetical protein